MNMMQMPMPGNDEFAFIDGSNIAEAARSYPFAVRQALNFATRLERGRLDVHMPDGRNFRFEGTESGPQAVMIVHDLGFARRLASGGEVGIAEAFLKGEWESPNLTHFLELFCVNQPVIQRLLDGKPIIRLLQVARHWLNRNTRAGSRRNIHAHYDLGNRFYSAWLDKTMTYSSALFTGTENDLASAQTAKYRALAHEIGLAPGTKFGFSLSAERVFGLDYATTLSHWRDRFRHAWPQLMPLGFDEQFRRLWEYYLAYCEAGFRAGTIDVRQMVFSKT
jgi:cyclopropane-fatty-acyl-phospholipid synthase